jgi:hypothetical protein
MMEYQEGPLEMVDRRDSVELVYTLPQGGKRKIGVAMKSDRGIWEIQWMPGGFLGFARAKDIALKALWNNRDELLSYWQAEQQSEGHDTH